MKARPSLRFVVGSALLTTPLAACGPGHTQEEAPPLRTNVRPEAPAPTPPSLPDLPVADPDEATTATPTTEPTAEPTGEAEHQDPSTNPASDPLINPSSGERLQQVPPDAPYHPAKQR